MTGETEPPRGRRGTGADSADSALAPLTVAVTGPTGTFGQALMPLLEGEPRVSKMTGVARRAFDPDTRGWSKLAFRRGDVRNPEDLRAAFENCDVVVHLAFSIAGSGRPDAREVNVEGTLNALRAAAECGVRRFVYTSSIAAYGFHPDNPPWMDEGWPVRGAEHLDYSREKAEVEQMIAELPAAGELDLYILRPPIVLGPNMVGAKGGGLELVEALARMARVALDRLPLPVPAAVPAFPIQLAHEEDVAQAILLCVLGSGPPGIYNIAAEEPITLADAARELGMYPIGLPPRAIAPLARALTAVPGLPPQLKWLEALSHPSLMDVNRARHELGWEPRFTALEALREALGP